MCIYFSGHDTATAGKNKYRPAYLDHFEKKEQEEKDRVSGQLKSQREQQNQQQSHNVPQKQVTPPPHRFQRSFIDGDYEFVSYVSIQTCCVCFIIVISHFVKF